MLNKRKTISPVNPLMNTLSNVYRLRLVMTVLSDSLFSLFMATYSSLISEKDKHVEVVT